MVHDFMITRTKLIIVAPPFRASEMGDRSFLESFEWQKEDHVQILVFDKNDLGNVVQIDVDPFWVFHFGNAYDLNTNEIGFDFVLHENPQFMTNDAFRIMDGSWDGKAAAKSSYARARLDLNAQRAYIERISDLAKSSSFKPISARTTTSTALAYFFHSSKVRIVSGSIASFWLTKKRAMQHPLKCKIPKFWKNT